MAKAVIDAGICGFITRVIARRNGDACTIEMQTDCSALRVLADALRHVDPMREISFRGEGPLTLALARIHCPHPACPVPAGILKAIEVEAGLALPKDVHIAVSPSEDE